MLKPVQKKPKPQQRIDDGIRTTVVLIDSLHARVLAEVRRLQVASVNKVTISSLIRDVLDREVP